MLNTVYCSSCGGEFHLRDRKHGFSHCEDHNGLHNFDLDDDATRCSCVICGKTGDIETFLLPASEHVTEDLVCSQGCAEDWHERRSAAWAGDDS